VPPETAWEEARDTGWFHPAELEEMRPYPEETIRDLIYYREEFITGCVEYLGMTEEEVVELIMEHGELRAAGITIGWLPPDLVDDLEEASP